MNTYNFPSSGILNFAWHVVQSVAAFSQNSVMIKREALLCRHRLDAPNFCASFLSWWKLLSKNPSVPLNHILCKKFKILQAKISNWSHFLKIVNFLSINDLNVFQNKLITSDALLWRTRSSAYVHRISEIFSSSVKIYLLNITHAAGDRICFIF